MTNSRPPASSHAWVTALAGCALLCLALLTVRLQAEVYMEGYATARCAEGCERLERRAAALRLEFERLRQQVLPPAPLRQPDPQRSRTRQPSQHRLRSQAGVRP